MQPKAESESRFQRWRFFWIIWFLGRLPQARSEMRLWRNTILKRLSNRGRCEDWKRKRSTLNVERLTPN